MFDNVIAEIKSKAEKADYYRKSLETERATREQADKQVIDLLHDVKNRYEGKFNSYMAKQKKVSPADKKPNTSNSNEKENNNSNKKKNKKGKEQNGDSWDNNSPQKEDNNGGWGESSNTNNDNNDTWNVDNQQSSSADNANNDNDQETADQGWDNNYNTEGNWNTNNNQDTADCGWGTTNDTDKKNSPDKKSTTSNSNQNDNNNSKNSKKNKKKGKDQKNDSWDNNSPNKDDNNVGWAESSNTNNNEESWDVNNKQSSKRDGSNKDNNQASTCQGSMKTENKDTTEDWGTSNNKDNSNKNNKDNKNNKKQSEPEKSKEKVAESPKQKAESVNTNLTGLNNKEKEFSDMKSQLLTAKLDLRIANRDNAKLQEELNSVKAERDNTIKKLAQARQDQDGLKMKVREYHNDLFTSNEEVEKLNKRIDELESDRMNRNREFSFGESKRRSYEEKCKAFQQTIAQLESEITFLKEEKKEFAKKAEEYRSRNERLEIDLDHTRKLMRTLKEGCCMVDAQVKQFEETHDTILMSKADLEAELVAIKEESSKHISAIASLQKSNEQISKAFTMSVEAHTQCKNQLEVLQDQYSRRLEAYKLENIRLTEANAQLRNCIEYQLSHKHKR